MELSDSSLKEFHVTVIKMFTKLRRKMDKHSENFHKETENIRKYQTEVTKLKNTITKLKNILEGFNIRWDEAKNRSASRKTKQ